MPPILNLIVVYDGACGLCTRVTEWMQQQVPLVGLEFVASGSPEALARYPQLPAGELAVVAGTGEVWLGNHAWIVCLWALRDYREFAVRLTGPLLLMMAREAFALVSSNRAALSRVLNLRTPREIEQEVRKVFVPKCN